MDFFGLEKYGKDDSQNDGFDSQSHVILDDTDEIMASLSQKTSSKSVKSQNSTKSSKSGKSTKSSKSTKMTKKSKQTSDEPLPELDELSNGYLEDESGVGEVQENVVDEINANLKELNKLLNKRKPRGKKANESLVTKQAPKGRKGKVATSTPVQSPLNTHQGGPVNFKRSVHIANYGQKLTSTPISIGDSFGETAALGSRRSGRLASKNNDLSRSVTPPPLPRQSKRRGRPKNTTNNVEVIDLISAPPLLLPGVVNLDSDDEDKQKQDMHNKKLADFSFEENYEISVKLRWKGKIEKHFLRKHQKFGDLMEKLAQIENVQVKQVVITMNDDKIIQQEDTPDSIDYKISTILTGRVIPLDLVSTPTEPKKKPRRDKNMIKIRLQAAKLKKPVEIYVDKTRKFSSIKFTIAETLKCDGEMLRLKFDGEIIDLAETPVDLDFDGGEMIDCLYD
uniref:CSON001602 protein n=1 Tax=Culicoides sonorensis TaxID=179676 RepID=A0A336L7V2_CULSO